MSDESFAPQRSQLWDIWLAPRGRDPFTVQFDELTALTVESSSGSTVRWNRDVQQAVANGWWVLDVVPAGSSSALVMTVRARARAAADRAGRAEIEAGTNHDLIRSIVGSRPLG